MPTSKIHLWTQAREWYNTIKDFFKSVGLEQSKADPCIFFKDGAIVFVYVDDILIAAENDALIESISNDLKKRFKMKDLGEPRHLDLVPVPEGIMLSGQSIIDELLNKFGMSGSRHVSTPMDANLIFLSNDSKNADEEDRLNYASAIGSLLYIANMFRPDICYGVSVLSQFTSNPSEDHWRGVKRVLRYLNGTRDLDYCFARLQKHLNISIDIQMLISLLVLVESPGRELFFLLENQYYLGIQESKMLLLYQLVNRSTML